GAWQRRAARANPAQPAGVRLVGPRAPAARAPSPNRPYRVHQRRPFPVHWYALRPGMVTAFHDHGISRTHRQKYSVISMEGGYARGSGGWSPGPAGLRDHGRGGLGPPSASSVPGLGDG